MTNKMSQLENNVKEYLDKSRKMLNYYDREYRKISKTKDYEQMNILSLQVMNYHNMVTNLERILNNQSPLKNLEELLK